MRMPPLALLLAALPLCAQLKEFPTTQKDLQSLAVTIYNENLALVKDTREVRLPKGEVALAFQEVSAQIRPETALLRDITHPEGFWVAKQNFDFDLLTPQKLLDKYVGEKVGIITTQREDNGKVVEKREEALVLATNSGTVLQFPDRIETSYVGRIVFPKVPENLRARRKQTDYKSLGAIGKYHYNYETAFEVELKNAKREPVTVSVLEPIYGDWEIIEESHPHTKESAGAAKFKVSVPAEGSAKLTYRVRTKW